MSNRDDAVERALALLRDAARREIGRQPRGHSLRSDSIAFTVELPLSDGPLDAASDATQSELRRAIEQAIEASAALRPGQVLDLRSGEADAAPPDGRHVFVGYEANGAPSFTPFHQWLLDIQHPEQEQIYRQPPGLVTVQLDEDDLYGEVLPAFKPKRPAVTIRGELIAGWFRVPHRNGTPGYIALTFQVLEVHGSKDRFLLEIIGRGPDGEPLEDAVTRLGEPPWRSAAAWGQKALDSIRFRKVKPQSRSERIQGILGGIARRLHQVQRGKKRRTGHAEKHHRAGQRPTRMAVADLKKADHRSVFFDRRHDTLVVLGERGRAHVWSPEGKLVTSIRYTPDSIERKRRADIWRPSTKEEAEGLKSLVQRHAD